MKVQIHINSCSKERRQLEIFYFFEECGIKILRNNSQS